MPSPYETLKNLSISYEEIQHPPLFHVGDELALGVKIPGMGTKNLFVRNRKKSQYYLVIIEHQKRADMKALAKLLGEERLSFGSDEDLMKYLGLTPGSVSALGLINDTTHAVDVVIDEDLLNAGKVHCHPNINTSTLVMAAADFKKFLDSTGNKVLALKL